MPTLISPSNMTSDTTPSPFVASASSEYSGAYAAWRAFDGDTTTSGWAATTGTGWLQIDLGTAQWVTSYTISFAVTVYGNPSAPNTWTLQGSPDGTTWTTLDTQSGQVFTNPQAISYTLATMGLYRYWRLNVTADNGSPNLAVGEFYLYGFPPGTTSQTITFPAITGSSLGATATSGLAVTYTVTSGPATVSGSTLTITGAGTITVQAAQLGDGTYAAATPVSQSITLIDFAPHDLTSNTSHSPYVASASSFASVYDAYLAFDGLTAGSWLGSGAGVDWLALDIGSSNSGVLYYYQIQANQHDVTYAPNAWTMQGSPNGTTWTTLDTRTGQTAWGFLEIRTFAIASPGSTAYRYFRLNVTANNGGALTEVVELYLYGLTGAPPAVPPNTQRGNIAYNQIRGTDRTGDGNQLLTWSTTVPATAGAAGNAGQIAYDGTYLYLCVSSDVWLRSTFVTW